MSNKILKEYSEKFIQQQIQRWRKEERTLTDEEARTVITRFDQIKSAIPGKIQRGEINVPKRFTDDAQGKPKNPQQLEFWGWNELESLIDAFGVKSKKVDKNDYHTVEDAAIVDVVGVDLVGKFNGLYVYKGDSYDSCVKLNYAFKYKNGDNQIVTYNFCIGRKEDSANRYYQYRFGKDNRFRSFYYCADSTQSAELKPPAQSSADFIHVYHFFVIHCHDNGYYGVTDAVNQFGHEHELGYGTWEEIGAFMVKHGGASGKAAWNKIKDHKDIFVYVPPSDEEVEVSLVKDRVLNDEQFVRLTRNQKLYYIQKNAEKGKQYFTREMFLSLDKRLQNQAIRSGYTPSYADISHSRSLSKAYASYRYRDNLDQYNQGKSRQTGVLPLPFIKYLTDDERMQYAKMFEDYLTIEYLDKYFGADIGDFYINKAAENFGYVSPEHTNRIEDPQRRKIYSILSKIYGEWTFSKNYNAGEDELVNAEAMSSQVVRASALSYNTWMSMSDKERGILYKLAQKADRNNDYIELLYGLPYFIEGRSEPLALVPVLEFSDLDSTRRTSSHGAIKFEKWVLTDLSGTIIKDNISPESSINRSKTTPDASHPVLLIAGSAIRYKDGSYGRICDFNDLQLKQI